MPIKKIIDICLLRAGPQDLPASMALMFVTLAIYASADVVSVLDSVPLTPALLAAGADTLLLAAAAQLALRWRHLENRLPQTLMALAGSGALLGLMSLAAIALLQNRVAPEWIWLVFLLWTLQVYGHILRHALAIPLLAAVGLCAAYILVSLFVTSIFIHPIAPEG